MKKIIVVSISIFIIILLTIGGIFAYLYFGKDSFKSDKQMYLKYFMESKDFAYNQLKDDDLDEYKKKLKNTPYENEGKISVSYDNNGLNNSDELASLENSNITIKGKVDKANRINSQNVKINVPQKQTTDIDLLVQDDTYGIRINNILRNYIVFENNNLKEWAKILGLNDEQIKLIPDKIDNSLMDTVISEDELNSLIEKYSKLIINELDDNMFSKITQNQTIIYSFKINESQFRKIALNVLKIAKDDESIWKIVRNVFEGYSGYSEEKINETIENLKKNIEEEINNSPKQDTDSDDLFGDTETDTAKEDSLLAYNLYIEKGKVFKIELINDDKVQQIYKTENGISIENKEKGVNDQEDVTLLNIEKNKEEEKLVYNVTFKENSKLIGSMSIGYKGLGTLNQVDEVATLNFIDLDTTGTNAKFQYYNKNTFNENLQINRIENNEVWKINEKNVNQISNVFETLSKKMGETYKDQNGSTYENSSKAQLLVCGLIPYFSIVGIDNIEYDQISTKDVASVYIGMFAGIINSNKLIYSSYLLDNMSY